MRLLTVGNPKIAKGTKLGWLSVVLHLAPHTRSGQNLCPWASPGCVRVCLNTAGRGGIRRKGERTNAIQRARVRRSRWFLRDRDGFLAALRADIGKAVDLAARLGLKLAVRLNGTSDIPWERIAPDLFSAFPGVQFYDYTKAPHRMAARLPRNYVLAFSRSESNESAVAALPPEARVAVVFQGPVPATWNGRHTVDGDAHDLVFLQPPGRILALRAKGRAKRDRSGFVVRT